VLKGTADRSILKSYEVERSSIAHDLIKFDHKFSRLFSGRPAKDVMDEEGISLSEFKEAFSKGNMFASGIAVNYGASNIVAKAPEEATNGTNGVNGTATSVVSRQELATEVKVGMRMPSFKVLNQSDARPWHFQERLPSNGTWRVVLFPGDLTLADRRADLEAVGKQLAQPTSFLKRFTPKAGRYDSVIEVLTVHSGHREEFGIFDFPEVLRPFHEVDGWDYNKIFVDDQSYHEGHGEAYKNYGIDPATGAAIVIRPDQYVAYVGAVNDYTSLDRFFSGFMLEQK
jgi:phenol 2-monooxygenase (NADPH)